MGRPADEYPKTPVTFRYPPEAPPYAAFLAWCAQHGWNVQRGLDELVQIWYTGRLAPVAPGAPQAVQAPAEPPPPAGAKLLADDYL